MKKDLRLLVVIVSYLIIAAILSAPGVYLYVKDIVTKQKQEQLQKKQEEERLRKEAEAKEPRIDYYSAPYYDFDDVLKTYDLRKDYEPRASAILFAYILNENLKYGDEGEIMDNLRRFGWLELAKAIEFDLDDDGKNEIIGFAETSLYGGTIGDGLFILKENDEGLYENRGGFVFFNSYRPISIMNHKSNGTRDIKKYNVKGDQGPDIAAKRFPPAKENKKEAILKAIGKFPDCTDIIKLWKKYKEER